MANTTSTGSRGQMGEDLKENVTLGQCAAVLSGNVDFDTSISLGSVPNSPHGHADMAVFVTLPSGAHFHAEVLSLA